MRTVRALIDSDLRRRRGTAGSGAAAEQVDLLLVLAADVSRSVDSGKFQLQREGYAAADLRSAGAGRHPVGPQSAASG